VKRAWALLLCVSFSAQAETLRYVEVELLFWLIYNVPELPGVVGAPSVPPVVLVPHAVLESLTQVYDSDTHKVLGTCYDDTIYLDDRLDVINDVPSRSVLLHELVHYKQRVCRVATLGTFAKEEAQAKKIQNTWTAEHALDANGRLRPSRWWKTNLQP
jgi:hypothetical protein